MIRSEDRAGRLRDYCGQPDDVPSALERRRESQRPDKWLISALRQIPRPSSDEGFRNGRKRKSLFPKTNAVAVAGLGVIGLRVVQTLGTGLRA
jgi:hypothetical protein